jgi:hypothetical protein
MGRVDGDALDERIHSLADGEPQIGGRLARDARPEPLAAGRQQYLGKRARLGADRGDLRGDDVADGARRRRDERDRHVAGAQSQPHRFADGARDRRDDDLRRAEPEAGQCELRVMGGDGGHEQGARLVTAGRRRKIDAAEHLA